ncbi:MAG: hypothetical protein ACE5IL_13170 [Myxococcota bacterium]
MEASVAGLEAHPAQDSGVAMRIAEAAGTLLAEIERDPDRRAEAIGGAFLACHEAAGAEPERFAAALAADRLSEFLRPAVRRSVRGEGRDHPTGGWLGTFVGSDARPIGEGATGKLDRDSLSIARQALARADALARAAGNTTLERNLRWYRLRLEHRSYAAIADAEARPAATIRTGVARARRFVLRVVHELEQEQPAPLDGEAPAELEPLRALWARQEIDALRRELDRTRERFGNDAHWLNLAGLVAQDDGRFEQALDHYERGLVAADAPSVRGRILNNLGNLAEDRERPDEARVYWLRAHQILPHAPAPLLNLLASACDERSYSRAQHYLGSIGALLRGDRLSGEERSYLLRRLADNPKFGWLRATDAWSSGPARWLRRGPRAHALGQVGRLVATLLLALGLSSIATPGGVNPGRDHSSRIRSLRILDGVADVPGIRVAGDSMGKTDDPRPRRPIRRVRG